MSEISVKCVDQNLQFLNTPDIYSGDVNVDTIHFDFCQKWTDYTKTAIFYQSPSEVYQQLLDSDNTCVIPKEVLAKPGIVYIGVFGAKGEEILTSEILTYRILRGAITEDLIIPDPTPDIYEQLLQAFDSVSSETIRSELTFKNVTDGLGYTPAELDENGIVLSSQLPSYVDDVLEFDTLEDFPETGESGKIYVATTTNLSYRWGGSGYVKIASDLALGETSATAHRGDHGKIAYEHSQQTSGNPHGVTKEDVGLDQVDNTADLDKPISTATQTALDEMSKSKADLDEDGKIPLDQIPEGIVAGTTWDDIGNRPTNIVYAEESTTTEIEDFPNQLYDTDIVDSMDSTETSKALSANQGRVLQEGLNTVNDDLTPQLVTIASTTNCTITGAIYKIGKTLVFHILLNVTDMSLPVSFTLNDVNMISTDFFAVNYGGWAYNTQAQIRLNAHNNEIYTAEGTEITLRYIRIDSTLILS